MEKVKINLDIVLPNEPDEKDACVQRIIHALESKRGFLPVLSFVFKTQHYF
jgi:Cd2+/Zn2+-exporting ATPase